MKIKSILHQQIFQLKWHILACLGLIMLLPIEEAVVNLVDGEGFYSVPMVIMAVMLSPLLFGLLACANVQGDLEQERYIFWRSKPVDVKLFMALKFIIGLIASLIILACPLVFGIISTTIFDSNPIGSEHLYLVPFSFLIAILTYSLCFACNVLVRKTARAWLIGMLLAGFLLVLPFMLPLGLKDFVSDVLIWTFNSYLVIMLLTSAAALVLALIATQYDWYLRTNLKTFLWVGAGLVFVALMLFNSQVANIKVLQEKEIRSLQGGPFRLFNVADKLALGAHSYVNVGKTDISLSDTKIDPRCLLFRPTFNNDQFTHPRQWGEGLYKRVADDLYSFSICVEYRDDGKTEIFDSAFFVCHELIGDTWTLTAQLDLSECLPERARYPHMGMRLFGNVLVVCINDSYVVVDVTNPGQMKTLDTRINVFKNLRPHHRDYKKESSIPRVHVKEIGIEEQIKLSIDRYHNRGNMYYSSIVDVHKGKIFFFRTHGYGQDIARFEVTHWDDKKVYYKLSASRPFTPLERLTRDRNFSFHKKFVKGGKIYFFVKDTLLVFDLRSPRGIRKLGHFVKMGCEIQDIEVLDDGRILLCAWQKDLNIKGHLSQKRYLYLLEDPE